VATAVATAVATGRTAETGAAVNARTASRPST
jgi:hypothetical protein